MKKVLSIVLSIVMVLCMMPAMAFAGTSAVFTDEAAINHDAAVGTLVALGVFEGYPDGSFQPAKVVTRAEMAKTIATVLNGGEAPVLSASTTSYTDTKGHWAAPYIEYCTSLGIVEGVGAGAFAPDAPVTAEQAAKMILVAQGYNAAVEGMTGAQWASNTNVLANQNGLYAELKGIKTEEGAAREAIAQMLYNVLAAKTIEKSNSVNKETGAVTVIYSEGEETVAEKYFGYTESPAGVLQKIDCDPDTGVFEYYLNGTATASFDSKVDYSELFGQNVKVLYKEDTTPGLTTADEVIGVFAEKSSVVATGLYGDVDATNAAQGKIKIAGVEYKIEGTSTPDFEPEFCYGTPSLQKYYPIKAIDNDADGKIDVFTYAPVKVERVTFVGVTSFSTTTTFTGKAFTDTDVVVYDGIAKDDYVAITTDLATEDAVVTKLEALDNAKVTSKTGTTSAVIGGETYKLADDTTDVVVGNSYDAAVINGYVTLETGINATFSVKDYAVVTAKNVETATTHDDTVNTTKVLTTAGETKVITLSSTTNATNTMKKDADPTKTYSGIVKLAESEGKYTVTPLATADTNEATDYSTDLAFVKKTDDVAAHITQNTTKYGIDADAVVFVANVDAKNNVTYSVITGADLAAKTSATVKEILVKTNPSTGYASVAMALVESVEDTTAHYAVVYGSTETTEVSSGKYVHKYNLSTGELSSPETASAATSVTKGQFVSYDINSKGEIVNVAVIGEEVANGLWANAVVKYDGTKIAFDGSADTNYDIDKDTVIIYVDSSDSNKVYEGGTVKLAEKIGSSYVKNVLAKADGDGDIVLLVVDVKNKMV